VILKRQWGAFYGTDLDLQLRRRGLTNLVLCGIATEYGVESTARDAYERGFDQVFVSDAMSALSPQAHEHCLTRIFPRMGHVRDTSAVLAALAMGK
jgi:nicotinamidase-related amidase